MSESNPTVPTRRPARTALSIVAGVLAIVCLMVSLLSMWIRSTLLDTDKFTDSVAAALEQPEVTASLARVITEQITEAVDLDGFVENALPGPLAAIGPVISAGAEVVVRDVTQSLLETEQAKTVLVELVRRVHQATIAVLTDDDPVPGVRVVGDEVSINLLPLVGRAIEAVQSRGVLTGLEIPELRLDGDPAQQIAALESTLGRSLPDDFGQLVVYRGEKVSEASSFVQTARSAIEVAERLAILLYVLTVVFFAVSLILARRTRRAAIILAIAAAGAAFIARRLVDQALGELSALVTDPGALLALTLSANRLTSGLLVALLVTASIAIAVAVLVFVIGSPRTLDALLTRHRNLTAIAAFAVAVVIIAGFGVGIIALALAILAAAFGVYLLATQPSPART